MFNEEKKKLVKEILNELKENYDQIGGAYYPEDLLGPYDPQLLYDYIVYLEKISKLYKNHIKRLKKRIEKLEREIKNSVRKEYIGDNIVLIPNNIHEEIMKSITINEPTIDSFTDVIKRGW